MRHPSREDRRRAAQEELEELLLEGVDSGPAREWTPADGLRVEVHEAVRAAVAANPPGEEP